MHLSTYRAIGLLPITICIRSSASGGNGPCIDAVRKTLFIKPGCERFQITTNVYASNSSMPLGHSSYCSLSIMYHPFCSKFTQFVVLISHIVRQYYYQLKLKFSVFSWYVGKT